MTFRVFIIITFIAVVFCVACGRKRQEAVVFGKEHVVPPSILEEHETLLAWMDTVLGSDSISNELRVLLRHHFAEEERTMMPLFGILPHLARGYEPENTDELAKQADFLAGQLGHMSAEHQMAAVLLSEIRAMQGSDTTRLAAFENALLRHARLEEEVLFPAAILAGRYAAEISRESERSDDGSHR